MLGCLLFDTQAKVDRFHVTFLLPKVHNFCYQDPVWTEKQLRFASRCTKAPLNSRENKSFNSV